MHGRIPQYSARKIIEMYCRFIVEEGRSPVTAKNYKSDLNGFVDWEESRHQMGFNLADIVSNDLKRFREILAHQFKPVTINRKLSTLNNFLRWAADSGLIERLEVLPRWRARLPTPALSRPRWLEKSEQLRLLDRVEAGRTPRDIAAICLMLQAGLRVSELCSLRWRDVEIGHNSGTITLLRGRGRSPLSIPLTKKTYKALHSMGCPQKAEHGRLVFEGLAGQVTRRWVDMLVQRYSRMAGLKNVTPTTLRDTFCANLVSAGASPFTVASFAGHSTLEMTYRYFAHPGLGDHPKTAIDDRVKSGHREKA